jgi:hypothetical protein
MRRWGWSDYLPVSRRRASRFPGPFVLDVDDGQPEQLDGGVVGRVVAAGFGDLAELVVQRLDGYLELSCQPGL